MTDPTDRLAAALHRLAQRRNGIHEQLCRGHEDDAAVLAHYLAADPTLICPDPADHAALQEARDGFVALQEHVRAVRCPDPADHSFAATWKAYIDIKHPSRTAESVEADIALADAVRRVITTEYPCRECLNEAYQGHEGGCLVGATFAAITAALEDTDAAR